MGIVRWLGEAVRPAFPQLSDEEVCRRVLAGESALYEVLMRRHNQRLYRAIRSILHDESEVEDAMQQAYVSAYAHLASFQQAARFSSWLVRIGVHEALSRARKLGRFTAQDEAGDEIEGPLEGPARDPEAMAVSHQLANVIEQAIDDLPELYRTVFVLREIEGMSTAEAALALEVSEDAVKQRLKRSRALLRKRLYARVGRSAREAFSFPVPRCDRVVGAVLKRLAGA